MFVYHNRLRNVKLNDGPLVVSNERRSRKKSKDEAGIGKDLQLSRTKPTRGAKFARIRRTSANLVARFGCGARCERSASWASKKSPLALARWCLDVGT